MELSEEKKENINFLSDFLLRLAKISGNASLEINKHRVFGEHYLLNIESENGENIFYHTNNSQIQSALHQSSRNIVARGLSTKKIEIDDYYSIRSSLDTEEYQGNLIKLMTTDNYPWEAIKALPFDLERKVEMTEENLNKIEVDKDKQNLADKLGTGIYYKMGSKEQKSDEVPVKDGRKDSKDEVLTKLIAEIAGISGNVSMNIMDGRYFISTLTKDGHYIVVSTTDMRLESRENATFAVRKSTEKLDIEELKTELKGNLSLLDREEWTLLQHDSTISEIKDNLSRDFGNGEHTASEISADLQEIGRSGLEESALTELVGETNTQAKDREEKNG